MKKFNILILLLAIFVALTVLVSCGEQDKQNEQDINGEQSSNDEGYFKFFPNDDGTYSVSCDKELIKNLTKIVIPKEHNGKAVTVIEKRGFLDCESLKTVTIPNSITIIEDGAFRECSNLTSIEIPNSVTSIGHGAFNYCSNLTSVTISNSVTSIGDYVFSDCTALKTIDVDESNPNYCDIDGILFTKDKKAVICCPAKKSESVFSIPNGTTTIYKNAFEHCSNLNSIVIPDSVTSIGAYAFRGCSKLTSIVVPNSVTSIGEDAFDGCSSLESMSLPFIGNGNDETHFGYFFGASSCRYNEDNVPKSLKSVTITACTSISAFAFLGCTNLTSIVIPNSVTSIGDSAFYNCSNLTIYCEAESKPSGWDANWNSDNCPVEWGYKG